MYVCLCIYNVMKILIKTKNKFDADMIYNGDILGLNCSNY